MSRALDTLASGARSILGRPLTEAEIAAFDKYLKLLQKWQAAQRLVGSADPEWIVEQLFLDSLLFVRLLPSGIDALADLGSGAGLPGIPIKIVRPEIAVTLIESRGRRVSFLSTVVRELGLAQIDVIHARAEDIAPRTPGTFGAVVMRCAGDPEDVVPIARRLAAPGGAIVVAGSPTERPIEGGEWVDVPGVRPGQPRKFVVFRA